MSNSFVQIYRDLLESEEVLRAPIAQRWVLVTILSRAVHSECTKDDHGVNIDLLPGQLIITIRKLAEWANVEKNDVERAIKRFIECKILRQEVRHRKTVLTILWGVKTKDSETIKETKVRQKRDTKQEEQENKTVSLFVGDARSRDNKKEENKVYVSPLLSAKTKNTPSGVITQKKEEVLKNLTELGYSIEEIQESIEVFEKYKGYISTTISNYLEGIIKNKRKEKICLKKKIQKEKPQMKNSKTQYEKDKGFYSGNDTSESPLAIFARQTGLK